MKFENVLPKSQTTGTAVTVDLPPRDRANYSLARGIDAIADGIRTLEVEVSDTIKQYMAAVRHPTERDLTPVAAGPSLRVPFDLLAPGFYQRGAHEVATASTGGELKFIEPGPFAQFLRGKSVVQRLGATVLEGLRGDLRISRGLTGMTASWLPESPTADATPSAMTLGGTTMVAQNLVVATSVTRKLRAQAAHVADEVLIRDMTDAISAELDRVAINGSGTGEPRGLTNTVGIGAVVGGTNGAAATWDHLVDLEFEVAVDNADLDALGYVTTPGIRRRLRKVPAIVGSTGRPAWNELDVPRYASTVVPSTGTKGTSTTICHSILFGAWADLVIGSWGALDVVVNPVTRARVGDVEVTVHTFLDIGVLRPQSFAAMTDALVT